MLCAARYEHVTRPLVQSSCMYSFLLYLSSINRKQTLSESSVPIDTAKCDIPQKKVQVKTKQIPSHAFVGRSRQSLPVRDTRLQTTHTSGQCDACVLPPSVLSAFSRLLARCSEKLRGGRGWKERKVGARNALWKPRTCLRLSYGPVQHSRRHRTSR